MSTSDLNEMHTPTPGTANVDADAIAANATAAADAASSAGGSAAAAAAVAAAAETGKEKAMAKAQAKAKVKETIRLTVVLDCINYERNHFNYIEKRDEKVRTLPQNIQWFVTFADLPEQ